MIVNLKFVSKVNKPEHNLEKSNKLETPNAVYKSTEPNNKNAEANAPKIKYFKPASVENSDVLFKLAKI